MLRSLVMTTAISLLPVVAAAQSNIDPTHKWAWGENVGWANWHDANSGADGVLVTTTFLRGWIWAENVGWLNVGQGPGSGVHYANNNGEDSGVNVAANGKLFGLAWGENVGWINFDGGALAQPPQPARIDNECRLRGYVWGENIGWLNLDHAEYYVGLTEAVRRGDMNCDCAVDFDDIDPFVLALSNPVQYGNTYPGCPIAHGDINNDGKVSFDDIDPFVSVLGQ